MAKWKLLITKSILIMGMFVIQRAIAENELVSQVRVGFPIEKPRIQIRIVVGENQRHELPYFSRIALEAARTVEKEFKIEFRDSFSIVFDNRPDYHNGLTTVVPTNRVYVHTEVPNIESSVGLVRESFYETTVHELAHMIIVQQRRGVFTPISWIFGNLSRPNSLFPRWVHEGFAVWAESQIGEGGRGKNGIIQADLRKYADYYRRTKKYPLTSAMLDGTLESHYVDAGTYPYHFGYLLIDDLLKDQGSKSAGELVQQRSGNLGFFFHKLYRDNKKVLTERFEELKTQWAAYPLTPDDSAEKITEAKTITGPGLSDDGLSWVENFKADLTTTFVKHRMRFMRDGKVVREASFTRAGANVVQGFWSESLRRWVLLTYIFNPNTNRNRDKTILLLSETGRPVCEISQIRRLREIAIDGDRVAWVRSTLDGYFYFERAKLDANCKLGTAEMIYKTTTPFGRLSSPWIKGNDWLLSRSEGQDLTRDYIIGPNGYELHDAQGALANPQRIDTADCRGCVLVTTFRKNYRGPALVSSPGGTMKLFPQRTEATVSYALGPKVYSNVALWEEDQIVAHTLAQTDAKVAKSASTSDTTDNPPGAKEPAYHFHDDAEKSKDEVTVENYGAFPSIVPHFWYPDVQAYDRGVNILAQTFFMDLSNNWDGRAALGFDTGASRPLGYLTVARKSLDTGMLDQISFDGASNFRYVGDQIQDLLTGILSVRFAQRLNTRFYAAVSPGVEFRRGSSTQNLKAFSAVAPDVNVVFASPQAVNVRLNTYQITHFSDGFYFNGRTRWLPEPSFEVYSNFQGKAGKFGYLIGTEYARTDPKSFPKIFYEWGGRPDFSTIDSGFLARGFKTGIGPSLQVLRGNFEFGFKVWSVNRGLEWNRFHLTDIELRPLYEVLTNDLYAINGNGDPVRTTIRMGHDYFQTAGAELDFFFQVLHYLDFKASFGAYQGFGKSGETQYGVRLASLADFL